MTCAMEEYVYERDKTDHFSIRLDLLVWQGGCLGSAFPATIKCVQRL